MIWRAIHSTVGLAVTLIQTSRRAPLFVTISRYIDQQMLADLVKAYNEGRLLFIGTSDLNSQNAVI